MSRFLALVALTILANVSDGQEFKTVKLVQTIPLTGKPGRFDHLALDAKGNRLFVANLSNDSLDIVDLKAGKLIKQIPDQKKSQGVVYVPSLNRIYQGNGVDGVCNVFDGTTFEKLHSLPLPDADNVRYNPDSRLVYVGHAENSLTAFDANTYKVKATVKLPGSPESFQIDVARKRMYVNCLKPGTVAVVNLETHTVIAKYPLTKADANYPLALDVKGKRLFVGCRMAPAVVILDMQSGKELAAVPIPADIDDLCFDEKRGRLYATCGAGFLAVLEEKDGVFALVEKVPTGKLARTGLYDPESDRMFIVVPRVGDAGPSLQIYQPVP